MRTRSWPAVVWPLLTLPVAAQNNTVPAVMRGVEGGSGSNIPFGTNQGVRYQCLYEREELPWSGPRLIAGISFRADNPDPGVSAWPAKQYLVVNLRMSTTAVGAAGASTEFEQNWGTDVTAVMGSVPVALPAQPAMTGVRPANMDFVFSVPWIYGLTPARDPRNPPPGTLLFDLVILSQPTGAYRLDNLAGCAAAQVRFGNRGPACANSGSAPMDLVPQLSMEAGLPFGWTLDHAPQSAPFLLLLNLSGQGTVFGLPLPVPLFDPNNPSQPPPVLAGLLRYSAPDCWINLEPAASFLGTTSATGAASITVGLPAGRHFVGMSLYAQAIATSQTANPLQVITSFGQQTSICGPLGTVRLYQTFPTGGTVPTVGVLQRGQGAVFEVR